MTNKNKKQLFGAIPYKIKDDCAWVLMVTSQTRKRWIFPNGNLEKGEEGFQAAGREALEEAGVKGRIDKKLSVDAMIGKSAPDGVEDVAIRFFPLEVTKQLDDWDEKDQRKRKWVQLDKAQELIRDDDFRSVVLTLNKNKFIAKIMAA